MKGKCEGLKRDRGAWMGNVRDRRRGRRMGGERNEWRGEIEGMEKEGEG